MSRFYLRAAASFAIAVATAVAGSPAHAADAPLARLAQVSIDAGRITVVMSAVGLAPNQTVDLSKSTLTIGDTPVHPDVSAAADSPVPVQRTVILAVDISGSMVGAPLAGAKAAVHSFVSTVPADVRVGLVAFGDTARLVTSPRTERSTLLAAADGLVSKGETALYDGVLLAVSSAGTAGSRTVVVLSDGADTVSTHKLADVNNRLSRDVLVDTVPFATTDAQTSTLKNWSQLTGGRSLAAQNAQQLASAFAAAAADARNQFVMTADIPESVAGTSATVTATVLVGYTTLSASTMASFPAQSPTRTDTSGAPTTGPPAVVGPAAVAQPASRISPTTLLYSGLGALFLAFVIVVAFAMGLGRQSGVSSRVEKHMAAYSLTGRRSRRRQEVSHFGDSAVARSAVELADRVAISRGWDASLRRRLDAAGVPLRPGEWVILHIGVTFVAGLLLFALGGAKPLPAAIGLVGGVLLPGAYLSIKESRRKSRFAEQLPEMLQLVSGSLSAGFSLPQAFDTAAREGDAPMAAELNRALVQTRLGMPLEDALEAIGERMQSNDFAWVVMAIRIQRDVGGNLAEVLTTVAETLRERERLRRQVSVLSAEGKLSAYILFALPVVMALYMIVVRPTYIGVLVHSPIGIGLIVIGIGLQAAGAFWMKKVTTVEV
jgi:tight adherence protein B